MKYTVILLRPDYMAGNFGQDTYMDHVEAPDAISAVQEARTGAINADYGDDAYEALPGDYFVLAVFAGWHDEVNPER